MVDADGVVERDYEASPTLGALFGALAKAQGVYALAKKDHESQVKSREGDRLLYKYAYADLASIWEACRAALSSNELTVLQLPTCSQGVIGVTTILGHSSGEWVRSFLYLALSPQATPQQIGSAITYLRRYAFGAIVGVASGDDDDGAQAEALAQAHPANTNARPPAPPGAAAARDMEALLVKAASLAELEAVGQRIRKMGFSTAMAGELRAVYEREAQRFPKAAAG